VVLDMERVPVSRRVYEIARAVPAGATLSYGEIAARLGGRDLARDVGQALGRNPFPLIVPCHRVLAAGGKAGGFSANGGVTTKLRLLSIEGLARRYPRFSPGAGADGRLALGPNAWRHPHAHASSGGACPAALGRTAASLKIAGGLRAVLMALKRPRGLPSYVLGLQPISTFSSRQVGCPSGRIADCRPRSPRCRSCRSPRS
jgi:O-6-methylguanine DNA methyltransferase